MVYTVRQFITECDNYQYSQEYFDILKESMEIDLMERYIKNQEFLIESGIDVSTFTESYFMEADNKSVEDVKGKVNEKKKNLFKRFLEFIVRQGKRFINFLRSGFSKIFKINQDNKNLEKEVVDSLNNISIVKDDSSTKSHNEFIKRKLQKIVDSVRSYVQSNIKTFEPYHLYYEPEENALAKTIEKYTDHEFAIKKFTVYLIASISSEPLYINTNIISNPDYKPDGLDFGEFYSLKDLAEFYEKLLSMIKSGKTEEHLFYGGFWQSRGIFKLDSNNDSQYTDVMFENIKKLQEELEKYKDHKFEFKFKSDSEWHNKDFQRMINEMNNVYAKLTKIYTEYYMLKTQGIKWAKQIKDIGIDIDKEVKNINDNNALERMTQIVTRSMPSFLGDVKSIQEILENDEDDEVDSKQKERFKRLQSENQAKFDRVKKEYIELFQKVNGHSNIDPKIFTFTSVHEAEEYVKSINGKDKYMN